MNIAVSFSLRLAENILNMSEGSFQNVPSSIYRVFTFYIIFSSIFLLFSEVFPLIKICSFCLDQVSNFIVNNAYSGQLKACVQI